MGLNWRFNSSGGAGSEPPPAPAVPVDELGSFGSAVPVGSPQESWNALVMMHAGATVSRADAIRLPAVKRARDSICDLAAILPLQTINASGERVARTLIDQPEAPFGLQRSYSLAWLLDDIFFYGTGCWHVVQRAWTTHATACLRVPFGRWSVDSDGTVRIDSNEVDPNDVIFFRSPKDGFLKAAAPTVKALLALEATATRHIAQPAHREFFRSRTGKRYLPQQIDGFLAQVAHWSRRGVSGFLPSDIERIEVKQPTAQELQLSTAREFGILEIARLTGLTASQLSVPTVSNTYANRQDERQDHIDLVAAPFLKTIEETLSDDTVTPHGTKVRWNYDAFLRTARTKERYDAYEVAKRIGLLSDAELRELENRPPLGGSR